MLSAYKESGHHTHVYPYVWKPAAGKKLHAEQEFNNSMDKFAVKMIKNNEKAGHLPRKYSRISWHFLSRGGKIHVCVKVTSRRCHSKPLCGGMEIPCTCRLVFSCSSKVKINYLKELLETRIANERFKIQMTGSDQQQRAFSLL